MESRTDKSLQCFYEEDIDLAEAMLNRLILSHPLEDLEQFRRDCGYYYSRILDYPLVPPTVIQFDFMRRCQLQCRICKIWSRQATLPEEELSFAELKKLFDQAKELGVSQCYFSGGEPFMLTYLFDILKYSNELGIMTEVTTNGLLLNEENCLRLLDIPLYQINVSIDGATASTHDYHRNRPGLFDIVINNLQRFADLRKSVSSTRGSRPDRPVIVMACVLTNRNFPEMLKYVRLAHELGVNAFFQPYASENDNYYKKTIKDEFVIPPERLPLLNQEIDRVIDYKMSCKDHWFISNTVDSLQNLKQYFANSLTSAKFCFAGFNRIIILKDRKVNVCPGQIGDFSKNTLREIWFSREAEDMRIAMRTCAKPCLMGAAYFPGPTTNDIFLITKRYLIYLQRNGYYNQASISLLIQELLVFRSKLSAKGLASEIKKLDAIIEYLRIKSDPHIRVKGRFASGLAERPVSLLEHLMDKVRSKRDSAVLKQISTLQFEVTNNCNLHCNICWRSLRGHQDEVKNLTRDKFTAIMDKLSGVFPGIREVNTQGLGEPLLCPDILEILADTKRRGLTVWFVTNGTLLDEYMAGRIVEIGVDKIRFSVDSANPEIYAAIKAGSSLEKVVRNITRLNAYKSQSNKKSPVLAFNSVLMKKNYPAIGSLIELARLNLVPEVTLIPLVSFSRGLSIDAEQVNFYEDAFRASFGALKKDAAEKGVELNLGISLESKETRFCNFGFYIDADCFVHPCCNISTFNFGNIYKQDAKVVVRNYLRFRRWLDVKNISCKECNRILDKR